MILLMVLSPRSCTLNKQTLHFAVTVQSHCLLDTFYGICCHHTDIMPSAQKLCKGNQRAMLNVNLNSKLLLRWWGGSNATGDSGDAEQWGAGATSLLASSGSPPQTTVAMRVAGAQPYVSSGKTLLAFSMAGIYIYFQIKSEEKKINTTKQTKPNKTTTTTMHQGLKMTQLKQYNLIWKWKDCFRRKFLRLLLPLFKVVEAISRKQQSVCQKMKGNIRPDLRTYLRRTELCTVLLPCKYLTSLRAKS